MEVSSSLDHFLFNNCDLSNVNQIYSMSDVCPGQNRNRTLVSYIMYFVNNHPTVDEWEHQYFISGHSFMANDSHFGILERAKNQSRCLYSPKDWILTVQQLNDKFTVSEMNSQFKDFSVLLKHLTFRGKNASGNQFNWMHLKYFKVTKGSTILRYKTSNLPDAPIMEIDFGKRGHSLKNVNVPLFGE